MAQFTREIIYDTKERAVVKFTVDPHSLTNGTYIAGQMTGSIPASSLLGYGIGVTSEGTQINLSKCIWSIPTGGASTESTVYGVSWGLSGSLTGSPFLYLSDNGAVDFSSMGFTIKNTLTGNYTNTIFLYNTNTLDVQYASYPSGAATIILEIDKIKGFGLTQAT